MAIESNRTSLVCLMFVWGFFGERYGDSKMLSQASTSNTGEDIIIALIITPSLKVDVDVSSGFLKPMTQCSSQY